ncbi:MAG: signal recognition particle protein [Planctomycetes bacterium]|nr:signal recognition particle protein [Planctomycetota bacterium]
MFESITGGLNAALDRLKARGKLTEANITDGLREVRMALLAADVHFKVVKDFVKAVEARAVGQEVIRHVRPGQQIVKIVQDELTALMGPTDTALRRNPSGPTVILMAGLQGSGKTTTCGKLAAWFRRKGLQPLLVAADLQRPAAIEQLQVLGRELGVPVHAEEPGARPVKVCERGVEAARAQGCDVVILDTAGRLHVDRELMAELKEIAERVRPQEVFLVCDAMTGQDAVTSAKEFNDQLEVSGLILTKLDGDARGGAALSIKAVTGRPVKFVGLGEKLDRLEEFHPDRMASRILGMGDIVGLVEKAQEAVDQEKALAMQQKLLEATFDLEDMRQQLAAVKKMGPLKDVLGMIPGLGKQLEGVDLDGDEIQHVEAIIASMTPAERRRPEIIDGRRRFRIARGSGTSVQEVNDLLKQFRHMRDLMKQMKKGGGLRALMGGRRGRH